MAHQVIRDISKCPQNNVEFMVDNSNQYNTRRNTQIAQNHVNKKIKIDEQNKIELKKALPELDTLELHHVSDGKVSVSNIDCAVSESVPILVDNSNVIENVCVNKQKNSSKTTVITKSSKTVSVFDSCTFHPCKFCPRSFRSSHMLLDHCKFQHSSKNIENLSSISNAGLENVTEPSDINVKNIVNNTNVALQMNDTSVCNDNPDTQIVVHNYNSPKHNSNIRSNNEQNEKLLSHKKANKNSQIKLEMANKKLKKHFQLGDQICSSKKDRILILKEFFTCIQVKYHCSVCKQVILNEQDVNTHIQSNHSTESSPTCFTKTIKQSYKCKHCKTLVNTVQKCIAHKSEICKKSMNNSKSEKTEIVVQRFYCPICKLNFSNQYFCSHHISQVHSTNLNETKNITSRLITMYKCHKCSKLFHSLLRFNRHKSSCKYRRSQRQFRTQISKNSNNFVSRENTQQRQEGTEEENNINYVEDNNMVKEDSQEISLPEPAVQDTCENKSIKSLLEEPLLSQHSSPDSTLQQVDSAMQVPNLEATQTPNTYSQLVPVNPMHLPPQDPSYLASFTNTIHYPTLMQPQTMIYSPIIVQPQNSSSFHMPPTSNQDSYGMMEPQSIQPQNSANYIEHYQNLGKAFIEMQNQSAETSSHMQSALSNSIPTQTPYPVQLYANNNSQDFRTHISNMDPTDRNDLDPISCNVPENNRNISYEDSKYKYDINSLASNPDLAGFEVIKVIDYICPICKSAHENDMAAQEHVFLHHPELYNSTVNISEVEMLMMKCKTCKAERYSIQECIDHKKTCHSTEVLPNSSKEVQIERFHCTECPLHFSMRHHCSRHMCATHGIKVKSRNAFYSKLTTMHECQSCLKHFQSISTLQSHSCRNISSKNDDAPFSRTTAVHYFCPLCEQHFPGATSCRRHITLTHPNVLNPEDLQRNITSKKCSLWVCHICSTLRMKYFDSKDSLAKHMASIHFITVDTSQSDCDGEEYISEKSQDCPAVGEANQKYVVHSKEEIQPPKRVAPQKPSKIKGDVQQIHKSPRNVENNSQNSNTAKAPKTKKYPPNSKNTHGPDVMNGFVPCVRVDYPCPVCNLKFAFEFAMLQHVQEDHPTSTISTQILPQTNQINSYKCKSCDISVDSIEDCKNHTLICKPFLQNHKNICQVKIERMHCPLCSQHFAMRHHCYRHMSKVHGDAGLAGDILAKYTIMFKCYKCSKLYHSIESLQCHIGKCKVSYHKSETKTFSKVRDVLYFCPQCAQNFTSLYLCKRHITLVHNDAESLHKKVVSKKCSVWICHLCSSLRKKYFDKKSLLIEHMLKHKIELNDVEEEEDDANDDEEELDSDSADNSDDESTSHSFQSSSDAYQSRHQEENSCHESQENLITSSYKARRPEEWHSEKYEPPVHINTVGYDVNLQQNTPQFVQTQPHGTESGSMDFYSTNLPYVPGTSSYQNVYNVAVPVENPVSEYQIQAANGIQIPLRQDKNANNNEVNTESLSFGFQILNSISTSSENELQIQKFETSSDNQIKNIKLEVNECIPQVSTSSYSYNTQRDTNTSTLNNVYAHYPIQYMSNFENSSNIQCSSLGYNEETDLTTNNIKIEMPETYSMPPQNAVPYQENFKSNTSHALGSLLGEGKQSDLSHDKDSSIEMKERQVKPCNDAGLNNDINISSQKYNSAVQVYREHCPLCNLHFSYHYDCVTHIRNAHPSNLEATKNITKKQAIMYKCNKCYKLCMTVESLANHNSKCTNMTSNQGDTEVQKPNAGLQNKNVIENHDQDINTESSLPTEENSAQQIQQKVNYHASFQRNISYCSETNSKPQQWQNTSENCTQNVMTAPSMRHGMYEGQTMESQFQYSSNQSTVQFVTCKPSDYNIQQSGSETLYPQNLENDPLEINDPLSEPNIYKNSNSGDQYITSASQNVYQCSSTVEQQNSTISTAQYNQQLNNTYMSESKNISTDINCAATSSKETTDIDFIVEARRSHCNLCGQHFASVYNCVNHVKATHKVNDNPAQNTTCKLTPMYKCQNCSKLTVSKAALSNHFLVCKSMTRKSEDSFSMVEVIRYFCPECQQDFSSIAMCKRHMTINHLGITILPENITRKLCNMWVCHVCSNLRSKYFMTKSLLADHMIKHKITVDITEEVSVDTKDELPSEYKIQGEDFLINKNSSEQELASKYNENVHIGINTCPVGEWTQSENTFSVQNTDIRNTMYAEQTAQSQFQNEVSNVNMSVSYQSENFVNNSQTFLNHQNETSFQHVIKDEPNYIQSELNSSQDGINYSNSELHQKISNTQNDSDNSPIKFTSDIQVEHSNTLLSDFDSIIQIFHSCELCNKMYENETSAFDHIRLEHGNEFAYNSSIATKDHKIYQCKTCQVKAYTLKECVEHKIVCKSDTENSASEYIVRLKRYYCPICFAHHSHRHHCYRHMMNVHNNSTANAEVKNISYLETIMYKCSKCLKLFHLFPALDKHMTSCKKSQIKGSYSKVKRNRYFCFGCEQNFSCEGHCKRHIKICHTDNANTLYDNITSKVCCMWVCHICSTLRSKMFYSQISLSEHMLKQHHITIENSVLEVEDEEDFDDNLESHDMDSEDSQENSFSASQQKDIHEDIYLQNTVNSNMYQESSYSLTSASYQANKEESRAINRNIGFSSTSQVEYLRNIQEGNFCLQEGNTFIKQEYETNVDTVADKVMECSEQMSLHDYGQISSQPLGEAIATDSDLSNSHISVSRMEVDSQDESQNSAQKLQPSVPKTQASVRRTTRASAAKNIGVKQ